MLLSRCLFHHNPAAIAPIAVGGFFWGRPGERLIEQMLAHYPDCLSCAREISLSALQRLSPRVRSASQRDAARRCVRKHGLMEWFSVHLQIRGVFTTLYKQLVPSVWQSSFRSGKRAIAVPEFLNRTYELERAIEPTRQVCAHDPLPVASCQAHVTWGR